MSRYESLVGKRVEAQYRASEIHLTATGTLISDSGESIVLEDRFSAGGKDKTMRVEVPYEYVISVAEIKDSPAPSISAPASSTRKRS
jgi:sporulation protein YlmC with PRC-barrel domain